jgi:DNA-binding protein Fis
MNGLTPIKVEDMLSQIADWAIESNAADAVLIRMRTLILTTVLELEGGNQCKAAVRLGMHRNTLWRQMHELGIPTRGKTSRHGRRRAA